MKVAAINTMSIGSTGRIMIEIGNQAKREGIEYKSFCGNWIKEQKTDECVKFGFRFENAISGILYRITGIQHVGSIFGTISLIKRLKEYQPDIIHVHNLHLWVINIPFFFKYIKQNNIPVIWTLHDCWSFTGQCTHFTLERCYKWKSGCHHCTQYKQYPASYVDMTRVMWKLKRRWFTSIQKMIIVTPSKWLSELVKDSYLNKYPVQVINNGIDTNVFKFLTSDFKKKYGIENKKIILGVSFGWDEKKGLMDFFELAKRLTGECIIVLVGLSANQIKDLPNNIIGIERTNSVTELAAIYSAANVFVNATYEDNYPTVNLEARACDVPIVTYNTGGSPESAGVNAIVLEQGDIDGLQIAVEDCIKGNNKMRFKDASSLSMQDKFKEYIKLYRIIHN